MGGVFSRCDGPRARIYENILETSE